MAILVIPRHHNPTGLPNHKQEGEDSDGETLRTVGVGLENCQKFLSFFLGQ